MMLDKVGRIIDQWLKMPNQMGGRGLTDGAVTLEDGLESKEEPC